MRSFLERCLRKLQDKVKILGFEEFDIFIVLGTFLILKLFKMPTVFVWGIGLSVTACLYFIKKGKPTKVMEHYVQWFFKTKQYTAVKQSILPIIKGRNFDIRLNALQSILPYSHMEDGFLVFNDDSLSAVYQLRCPYLGNQSQEELIGYSSRLETLLNNLTDKATYQIRFDLDGSYEKEITRHQNIRSTNPLIQAMHAQRVERMKTLESQHVLQRVRCYFLINYGHSDIKAKKMSLFKNSKKRKEYHESDVRKLKTDFQSILTSIEGGLEETGFSFTRLNTYEQMQMIYDYLNPDRIQKGISCPKPKDNESFLKQVCCSDLFIDQEQGESMQWGGMYHKFLTLKVLPEATHPGMLESLFNLSFKEFDLIVNFEAPPKEWGRKMIESMRRREYGNLLGMMGVPNKEAEVNIQQYESFLEEIQKTNQKLFRMQMTVHVYGESVEDVKKKTDEVIRHFSLLEGAEMHNERWGAVLPIFLSTLPGWIKESSRWVVLKTLHVADFLPLFGEFSGSGNAETLFFNTTEGLASYDPFANDLPAFNSIVIGSAGSGKSFLVNQIINQYSKNNPIEIFIDIGGSYQRQVLLKGGEYINLGLKQKFTLNLFDLPGDQSFGAFDEETQNEILIIKSKIIEQMIGKTSVSVRPTHLPTGINFC